MAGTDIPLSHLTFGLFEANPSSATASVAASDVCCCGTKHFFPALTVFGEGASQRTDTRNTRHFSAVPLDT